MICGVASAGVTRLIQPCGARASAPGPTVLSGAAVGVAWSPAAGSGCGAGGAGGRRGCRAAGRAQAGSSGRLSGPSAGPAAATAPAGRRAGGRRTACRRRVARGGGVEGHRFGSGALPLALWTGCLTRGEDQCLHRRPCQRSSAPFGCAGPAGKRKPPALPGFRWTCESGVKPAPALAARSGCDTPDRGGRKPSRTGHKQAVRRERDRRSDGGTKDPHPAEVL